MMLILLTKNNNLHLTEPTFSKFSIYPHILIHFIRKIKTTFSIYL